MFVFNRFDEMSKTGPGCAGKFAPDSPACKLKHRQKQGYCTQDKPSAINAGMCCSPSRDRSGNRRFVGLAPVPARAAEVAHAARNVGNPHAHGIAAVDRVVFERRQHQAGLYGAQVA